ncbi:MAG: Gx transporter family protein [Clostridia bacterium]|nr:Gx transporter family protein [Clostridia bacterium]
MKSAPQKTTSTKKIKKINVKKVAFAGLMTALSLALGYLEHLVPLPIGIYGIKLGLANLAVVTILYLFDGKTALSINALRIALSSLLFGNTVSLAYSVCGGLLSTLAMIIAKRTGKLGITGVSILGGITHNTAQLAVAVFLVDNLKIAFYLPVLLAVGALTGFLIGACALPVVGNSYIKKLCGNKEGSVTAYDHKERRRTND